MGPGFSYCMVLLGWLLSHTDLGSFNHGLREVSRSLLIGYRLLGADLPIIAYLSPNQPTVMRSMMVFQVQRVRSQIIAHSINSVRVLPRSLPSAVRQTGEEVKSNMDSLMVQSNPAALAPRRMVFAVLLGRGQTFRMVLKDCLFVGRSILRQCGSNGIFVRTCRITIFPAAMVRVVLVVIDIIRGGLISQLHPIRSLISRQLARRVLVEPFQAVTRNGASTSSFSLIRIVHPGRGVVLAILISCQEDPRDSLHPFRLYHVGGNNVLNPVRRVLKERTVRRNLLLVWVAHDQMGPVNVPMGGSLQVNMPALRCEVAALHCLFT